MGKSQKGEDLMLSIGGVIYGLAADCNFEVSTDTKEIAKGEYKHGNSAGEWKNFKSVANGWTCDSNYLLAADGVDFNALFIAMTSGVPVATSFSPVVLKTAEADQVAGATGSIEQGSTGFRYSGMGIITSLKVGAPQDGDATYSVNIQGTGALTPAANGAAPAPAKMAAKPA